MVIPAPKFITLYQKIVFSPKHKQCVNLIVSMHKKHLIYKLIHSKYYTFSSIVIYFAYTIYFSCNDAQSEVFL